LHAILDRLDLVVVAVYMAGMLAIGGIVSRKSQTAEGYTVGDRSFGRWVLGLSIVGTLVSSLSFLGQPSAAFNGNWNFLVFALTMPIGALFATAFFVPLYRRELRVSAYELLEERFGYWARLFADVCFAALQLLRVASVSLYVAIAVAPMLGLPRVETIVAIGVVVVVYDVIGGIRAIIWTDVVQVVVLFAGAIWCLVSIASAMPEGAGQIVEVARRDGKLSLTAQPWYGLAADTVLVMLLYGVIENLRNFGVDQNHVQRMFCARTNREASYAFWIASLSYVPSVLVFLSIGTCLYAYYHVVEPLPEAQGREIRSDEVFPTYIQTKLPKLVAGLVISALLAAAMSTIDASLNATSTVYLSDVVRRFRRGPPRVPEIVTLRVATIATGVAATALAVGMSQLKDPRTLFDQWLGYAGSAGFPLLAIFLMAWLTPRIASGSAAVAAVAGVPIIAWGNAPKSFLDRLGLGDFAWPLNAKLVGVAALGVMIGAAGLLLILTRAGLLPTNPRWRARS
jgi:SSS family solute:Na+ symporter